ncbi:metabotropic glutamate receptor 1 [Eurytemora carolleeae]|uniref:metabotropic glutamate receptor 1 n=1 Tax=Eurytemora carolleeae TaxID=1294199 RepID=UPI000C7937B6|nr:metabotropic glutamate receptor 1 [Eurytemora carolleeae]|eukprot:XP_023319841.1 metabotropic glutamate receptor 1-like [Eurytemora affinis]
MFARTVWSDEIQARAIYDIIQHFDLASFKVIGTVKDSNSDSLAASLEKEIEYNGNTENFSICDIVRFPVLSGFSNQCACSVKSLSRVKRSSLDESQTPVFDGSEPSLSDDGLPPISGDDLPPISDGGRPPISDDGRPHISDGSRPSISSDPNLSTEFEALVNHINKSKVDAFVVAIKAESKIDFLRVLQDLKRSGSQPRRLQMIATDTWDISDDLGVYNVSDFLEGSITIVPENSKMAEESIRNHLKNLVSSILETPQNNSNPWLRKIWKSVSCCSTSANLADCDLAQVDEQFAIDTKIENVMNAAVLFSEAIESFFSSCELDKDCLYRSYQGDLFFKNYIMRVNSELKLWEETTQDTGRIHLDCIGNSPAKYAIYQFFRGKFQKIGNWEDLGDHTGKLNIQPVVQLKNRKDGTGSSLCSPICTGETYQIYDRVSDELTAYDDCCYSCQELQANAVLQQGQIKYCEKGSWPGRNRTVCEDIPIETLYNINYLPVTIGISFNILASIGILSIWITVYLNKDKEVIINTGYHYVPFLLGGGLLCQVHGVGVFILQATPTSCYLLQLMSALGPTLILAAILVKTYKIYQIFIKTFQDGHLQLQSSLICSKLQDRLAIFGQKTLQIAAVTVIIALQLCIVIVGNCMNNTHGVVIHIYPANRHIQVCDTSILELFTTQIFNIILLIVATFYGYMARHVPSKYNETKFISFAMFAVFLITIAGTAVLLAIHESAGYDKDSKEHEPELEMVVYCTMVGLAGVFTVLLMFTNKLKVLYKLWKRDKMKTEVKEMTTKLTS